MGGKTKTIFQRQSGLMNQEHIVFTFRVTFTLEAGIITLEELSNKIHKLNKNSYLASFNHELTRAF